MGAWVLHPSSLVRGLTYLDNACSESRATTLDSAGRQQHASPSPSKAGHKRTRLLLLPSAQGPLHGGQARPASPSKESFPAKANSASLSSEQQPVLREAQSASPASGSGHPAEPHVAHQLTHQPAQDPEAEPVHMPGMKPWATSACCREASADVPVDHPTDASSATAGLSPGEGGTTHDHLQSVQQSLVLRLNGMSDDAEVRAEHTARAT
jgi:hypothetical protein